MRQKFLNFSECPEIHLGNFKRLMSMPLALRWIFWSLQWLERLMSTLLTGDCLLSYWIVARYCIFQTVVLGLPYVQLVVFAMIKVNLISIYWLPLWCGHMIGARDTKKYIVAPSPLRACVRGQSQTGRIERFKWNIECLDP